MTIIVNGSNTPTAGAVGYGDGTNLAFTSAGTTGQFLSSNGSSAPSWVGAPASAMTLISTQTASSSASLAWTGLSGYNSYKLIFSLTPASNAYLSIVIGSGAGPTYLTSNYYASSMNTYGTSANPQARSSDPLGSPSSPSFFGTSNVPVKGTYPVSAELCFGNFTSGSPFMVGTFQISDANNTYMDCGSLGQYQTNNSSSTPITAIQIQMNNMTGKASLYGISS